MPIEKAIDDLCRELAAADTVGKSHTIARKAIRSWEAAAKATATEQPVEKPRMDMVLHILRNPYGKSSNEIQQARHDAADFIEKASLKREFSEAEKLLAWIFKLYANYNLSFADNWYAEAGDFFNNRRRG